MRNSYQEATLKQTAIPPGYSNPPSLRGFLQHVYELNGKDIQGLAFATNGTWAVLGFNNCSSAEMPKLSVTPIDGRDFDPTKVFELRLWLPVDTTETATNGEVLAREFRWVNGVGAVEMTLTESTPETASQGAESRPSSVNGWFNRVSYLKHESAANSDEKSDYLASVGQTEPSQQDTATKDMTAVEFIQAEDKYGNTVVVDQLFTGEWS
ncbi:hypothetical protein [Actinomyces sp. ICM47]|uniref:hypothetical protein n=1 Tax=Actinomyces sp. ICM47 TaxID=936548 RepID=UPI0025C474A8|nr:hypothetical protein [Actinomyces sp. ICM47]